jgi:hypothetical protein
MVDLHIATTITSGSLNIIEDGPSSFYLVASPTNNATIGAYSVSVQNLSVVNNSNASLLGTNTAVAGSFLVSPDGTSDSWRTNLPASSLTGLYSTNTDTVVVPTSGIFFTNGTQVFEVLAKQIHN